MPFYEYECSHCKFYVEALQKISDAPLKKCPSCGRQTLKKLVSAPVFRLKGGGWYETDFKSDQEGKRNLAGADEAPPSDGAKSDGAKDAKKDKPEAKSDAKSESKSESRTESRPAAKKTPARSKAPAKSKARPAKKKSKR